MSKNGWELEPLSYTALSICNYLFLRYALGEQELQNEYVTNELQNYIGYVVGALEDEGDSPESIKALKGIIEHEFIEGVYLHDNTAKQLSLKIAKALQEIVGTDYGPFLKLYGKIANEVELDNFIAEHVKVSE